MLDAEVSLQSRLGIMMPFYNMGIRLRALLQVRHKGSIWAELGFAMFPTLPNDVGLGLGFQGFGFGV